MSEAETIFRFVIFIHFRLKSYYHTMAQICKQNEPIFIFARLIKIIYEKYFLKHLLF